MSNRNTLVVMIFSEPLVSICIPVYNAVHWLPETLDRLKRQTYSSIEVIIVDDHSTDNSLQIAQAYESDSIQVYSNPKKGGNSARNYAFQMSKGDYIKFMDADDYMDDSMIELQVARLLEEDNPENCIVLSPVIMRFQDGIDLHQVGRSIDHDYSPGIELLIDIWRGKGWNCPHCHLMHHSLVKRSKGWDETVVKNQDGEYFGRVYTIADKVVSVKQVNAIWRQTGIGVSTKMNDAAMESVLRSYRILADLILSYKSDAEHRDICSRYISSCMYSNYPTNKKYIPEMERYMKENGLCFKIPNQRRLKVLCSIVGWKLTACIFNYYK